MVLFPNWSSISSFITNPNNALAFNLARGATALGASLFSRPETASFQDNVSGLYDQAQIPFQAGLNLQRSADEQQIALYDMQAQLALDETELSVEQRQREVEQFAQSQALAYSGSGVLSYEGTPTLVIADTYAKGQREVEAMRRSAEAQASYLRRQGMALRTQSQANILAAQSKFDASKLQDLARVSTAGTKKSSFSSIADSLGNLLGGVPLSSVPRQTAKPKASTPKPKISNAPTLRGFLPQAGFTPPKGP
jgi:hypothetical protein